MGAKGQAFAGVSVAIVTPFKDDAVDYERLKEQVEFQITAGVACLCPVGTTAMSVSLPGGAVDGSSRVGACTYTDGRSGSVSLRSIRSKLSR